jgi:nitroreductase
MELKNAQELRRSIRKFKTDPIRSEIILSIIEAANTAPSACNIQGWRYIVVDNEEKKQSLIDNGGSVLISKSPTGILVIYDNRTTNPEYQDYIQSAAASIQNIHLKAVEEGLGSCWICHLPPKKIVRKIFSIPIFFDPIAYILLGYPVTLPQPIPRKLPTEKYISYNKASDEWGFTPNPFPHHRLKTFLAKIYYKLPLFLKKILLNKYVDKNFVKKFEN